MSSLCESKMSTPDLQRPSFNESWYAFNEDEKKLLRKSWKTIAIDTERISCSIYTMIFNQCPEARKLFPFMRLPVNNSDKKSKEFIFQALRFIQVLESGISHLDNLNTFNPILDNLGRRHGKLESNVGFQPCYWSVFMECTIYNIRLALMNSKVDIWNEADIDMAIVLWRHLINGICDRIKVGYLADIANRSNSKVERSLSSVTARAVAYYEEAPRPPVIVNGEERPIERS